MKTVFKLAAVASLVVSSYAFAVPYDLGALGPPGEKSQIVVKTATSSQFEDTFTFSINAQANATGAASDTVYWSGVLQHDVGIDTWGLELFKDNVLVTRLWNSPIENTFAANGNFSFSNLNAGNYTVKVTGATRGLVNGTASYTLSLATAATAVPEPEAYAMMLAGLGLVGFAARRKMSA